MLSSGSITGTTDDRRSLSPSEHICSTERLFKAEVLTWAQGATIFGRALSDFDGEHRRSPGSRLRLRTL